MKHTKGNSSEWINKKNFIGSRFSWQEGYGAFSYGKSQVSQVIKYIERQEEHHKKETFMEGYRAFLMAFNVEYDERYIFKTIDY